MANHFKRRSEVAVFHRGYVAQVFVLLRRVVVEPLQYLANTTRLDVDGCLAPDHLATENRAGKTIRERYCTGIRRAAAMGDAAWSGRKISSLDAGTSADNLESRSRRRSRLMNGVTERLAELVDDRSGDIGGFSGSGFISCRMRLSALRSP